MSTGSIPDVVPFETIASASWGNPIRDRTVTPFDDATQRDADIPSPTTGMVCYVIDIQEFQVYNGTAWVQISGSGSGAPADATYLTTTSNVDLTNEVVVGTTPGGELGGTWASPTVDTVHSGSSHAATQAAAEATAAAALSAHVAAGDPHPVYLTAAEGDAAYDAIGAAAAAQAASQPLDADLTAIAAFSSTGLAARTASNTWAQRTIAAGTAIGVTNGDGVSGNPTIAVNDAELTALAGTTSAADKVPYYTGSGTASTTDFGALGRASVGQVRQTFSNAPVSIAATTGVLAQTGTMSASQTATLPAASALTAGSRIWIMDESGSVTSTNTIVIARAGSDTIDGLTSLTITVAYGFRVLESDGSSKWTVVGSSIEGTSAASLPAAGGVMDSDDTLLGLEDGVLSLFLASQVAGTVTIDTQTFPNVGTFSGGSGWQKPTGAVFVHYRLIGGGSGGGSGQCAAAGNARAGGGGGGSGGVAEGWIPASVLGSQETVVVGDGGNGGAAVGPGAANGNSGSVGNPTTFGTTGPILTAGGGGIIAGGIGGGVGGGGGDGAFITMRMQRTASGLFNTAAGSAGGATGAPSVAGDSGFAHTPAGGGGGAGVNAATPGTEAAGANGGATYSGGGTGGTGGAARTAGNAPTTPDPIYQYAPGSGGGGSCNANTASGGAGAAGVAPGGGGGGGGGGTSGGSGTSGAGGKGGKGYARLTTICVRS